MSGCIPHLSSLHSPVFLLNSCLDLFSAPPLLEDPFSRSYGVSLPSSLATDLSTPQYVLPDYVCPFAVRVPRGLKLSGFSREYGYLHCRLPPKGVPYFRASSLLVDLPARICDYTLQRGLPSPAAVSLLRHHVAPCGSHGMLTVSAIGLALRLILRTRLTPG